MSPPNAVGYIIDEKSLWWSSFDVVVKCDTPTYIGHAKVEVCTDKEKPYLIHGCAKYINCKTPATTRGYVITETGTELHNWDVKAQCAALYHGAAKVTECDDNGLPYGISGCEPDTCIDPTETAGYDLTVQELELWKFSATVSCASGYVGDAKVEKCDGHGLPYKIDGCLPTTTTTSTTTTTTTTTIDEPCFAPKNAVGYKVTENSVHWTSFDVTATCADRFYGHAHVKICTKPDMIYYLSGCTRVVTCKTPSDTLGYHVKESNLDTHQWDVTASCSPKFHGTAKASTSSRAAREMKSSVLPRPSPTAMT